MTTEKPWRIKAGQREQRTFTVADGGQSVDVTGWTVDAYIRSRPGSDMLHTFAAEHVSVDGSQVTLTIPAPVSAAWHWTIGWYRIKVTAPDSPADDPHRSRVLEGPIVVDPD